MVVSAKLATLRECDEYYSLEDVYDLLEILTVDSANERLANKARE